MDKTLTNLFITLFLITILGTACNPATEEKSVQFQVGQKWKFSGRLQDPEPRLVIGKIDFNDKTGNIIHVSVTGVRYKDPEAEGGFSSYIGHLPFNEEALRKSVTEIISENNSFPEFQEGYNIWKEAFDQGEAGAFNISVAETVELLEITLKLQKNPARK